MKVILKDFVKGFGEKNDIVEVKNGFGRNYLIPQGLATIATPSAIKMAEENVRIWNQMDRTEFLKEIE